MVATRLTYVAPVLAFPLSYLISLILSTLENKSSLIFCNSFSMLFINFVIASQLRLGDTAFVFKYKIKDMVTRRFRIGCHPIKAKME